MHSAKSNYLVPEIGRALNLTIQLLFPIVRLTECKPMCYKLNQLSLRPVLTQSSLDLRQVQLRVLVLRVMKAFFLSNTKTL